MPPKVETLISLPRRVASAFRFKAKARHHAVMENGEIIYSVSDLNREDSGFYRCRQGGKQVFLSVTLEENVIGDVTEDGPMNQRNNTDVTSTKENISGSLSSYNEMTTDITENRQNAPGKITRDSSLADSASSLTESERLNVTAASYDVMETTKSVEKVVAHKKPEDVQMKTYFIGRCSSWISINL
jgi:hypothetical protein